MMKILFLIILINKINGYGEIPQSWDSREVLVMMNSLRMNPNQYKENFMKPYGFKNLENVITTKYYEPVSPLQFNEKLFDMALSHSIDMSQSEDCFTFENCNGTSFYDRIDDWKCDENTQEHIYKSSTSNNGFKAINRLICRNSVDCLKDDDPNVGDFRDRIMGKDINYSGTGIVFNESLSTWFYTMDFTLTSCTPENDQQSGDKSIISATHTFKYGDPKSITFQQQLPITFLANYYNSTQSIDSFYLFIIGKNINLKVTLNKLYSSDNDKTTNGVYSITLSENSYSTCDYYYFQVTTQTGQIQRYPTKGFLKIIDYKQSCNGVAWSESSSNFSPLPSLPQNHFYNFFPNFINSESKKVQEIDNDKSITSNTTILIFSNYLTMFLISILSLLLLLL
ncbi:hypothetical protein RB653_003062 [Dictyostelium firmibasis]|uniref:SCP domain-containing protein n=1 Tax=Dictyostelium firmibasis TaxID=79012 RepID=A0AAN7TRJ4_9MYCE